MKITLWICLCGLCITAGHLLLGVLALVLLLGCVPLPRDREPGPGPERPERVPHLV